MKTAFTPGRSAKWTIDNNTVQICVMQGSLCIADCGSGEGAYDHAARIVATSNAHDDLVAALQNILAICPTKAPPEIATIATRNWKLFEAARAALAKAGVTE